MPLPPSPPYVPFLGVGMCGGGGCTEGGELGTTVHIHTVAVFISTHVHYEYRQATPYSTQI